jgi:hypothetical protein
VTELVNPPPIRGPIIEASPKTVPNIDWNRGRLCSGINGIIMSIHPENIPADARPAMARPAIKAPELGAAPQMAEPISKRTTVHRKMNFIL